MTLCITLPFVPIASLLPSQFYIFCFVSWIGVFQVDALNHRLLGGGFAECCNSLCAPSMSVIRYLPYTWLPLNLTFLPKCLEWHDDFTNGKPSLKSVMYFYTCKSITDDCCQYFEDTQYSGFFFFSFCPDKLSYSAVFSSVILEELESYLLWVSLLTGWQVTRNAVKYVGSFWIWSQSLAHFLNFNEPKSTKCKTAV